MKTKYLKGEQLMWLRALDFIQHENISLKNTIAEILKSGIAPGALEEIEFFQNQFLNKDAVIALLRRDIAINNKQVTKEPGDEGVTGKRTTKKHYRLREDMARMEKEFSQLKYGFSDYLLKNF